MTKDKALDLVLETLERMNHADSIFAGEFDKEIAAIKQARSAPVQEPVACVIDGDLYFHHEIDWEDLAYQGHGVELLYTTPPAAPVQEPVLQEIEQYRLQMAGISTAAIGYWKEGDGIHPDYDTPALRDVAKLYAKYDALYTAAQRQWVGLTDEEKRQIFEREDYQGWLDYINAIEAKLKEKNT
jgi:hypothetical protein